MRCLPFSNSLPYDPALIFLHCFATQTFLQSLQGRASTVPFRESVLASIHLHLQNNRDCLLARSWHWMVRSLTTAVTLSWWLINTGWDLATQNWSLSWIVHPCTISFYTTYVNQLYPSNRHFLSTADTMQRWTGRNKHATGLIALLGSTPYGI